MTDEVATNQLQLEEYFNQITGLKPSFTVVIKFFISLGLIQLFSTYFFLLWEYPCYKSIFCLTHYEALDSFEPLKRDF